MNGQVPFGFAQTFGGQKAWTLSLANVTTDAAILDATFINQKSASTISAVFDLNGTRIYPSVQDPNANAWTKVGFGPFAAVGQ